MIPVLSAFFMLFSIVSEWILLRIENSRGLAHQSFLPANEEESIRGFLKVCNKRFKKAPPSNTGAYEHLIKLFAALTHLLNGKLNLALEIMMCERERNKGKMFYSEYLDGVIAVRILQIQLLLQKTQNQATINHTSVDHHTPRPVIAKKPSFTPFPIKRTKIAPEDILSPQRLQVRPILEFFEENGTYWEIQTVARVVPMELGKTLDIMEYYDLNAF
jgi:hypothetical protein